MSVVPIIGEGEFEIDDEEVEREEFELDELLQNFVSEPPIQHDVLPESDEDNEEEEDPEAPQRMRTHIRRGDGHLYRDQTFFNGVAFKDRVLDYALRTRCNIRQYRYDKDKLGFECAGLGENDEACGWKIYASILPKDKIWRVRLFVDNHTCEVNGECEMVKVPVIARLFVNKIREEPAYYMPMKIEELIMANWSISVSRPQCQAGRNKALKWIKSEHDQQFARLKDYAAEIVESNPGSSVEVDTFQNDEGQDVFNRIYICFDALRNTWKESCRPLIGLDGCFLKERIKGQLLVALGRDANNAIYPIAWAVVKVENNENWQWFMQKLKVDLDLKDGDNYIAVSDRSPGLIRAIKIELPKMEHRKCVRHIYGNLKKKHGNKKQMKSYIWSVAWSYNEAKYQQNLDRLSCYDTGVYTDVMATNPRSWCRAFFKLGNYCEDVENNSTESFNSSINKAREKSFVHMLETIARLAMVRIATRSRESHEHQGKCTPYVQRVLAKALVDKPFKDGANKCVVRRSVKGYFDSRLNGHTHRVHLEKRTCSCRKFDITGIPCKHAYGVMLKLKVDPSDFVCEWFRTAKWRRNYTDGIVPVRGSMFWPKTDAPDVHAPP
ncbi:uncharacterized protein LOC106381586 isoform X2 [Brassica napus]|uniref:uncharacterized protein LOC106381586 isoform X2 n=1 Tax=Brassica napus TaxID=3708 RepID=UPI00207AE02B|nr:uncharacterized protein LOC106381586 isoform X2 [Brassica napus]